LKIFFINIACFLWLCSVSIFGQLPVVKVLPSTMDLNPGQTGEIFIRVENVPDFRAYSIRISYDKEILRCLSITKGNFFSGWSTFFYPIIDSNTNVLGADEAILGTGYQSGSGDLIKVTFLALKEGNVNLNFVNADLRDSSNTTLQIETENGVVNVVKPTSVEDVIKNEYENYLISYPNPFNSSTRIEFKTNRPEETELSIFSITGEKVFELKPESGEKNFITFIWDGKDFSNRSLAGGVYFLKATSGTEIKIFKLILLK